MRNRRCVVRERAIVRLVDEQTGPDVRSLDERGESRRFGLLTAAARYPARLPWSIGSAVLSHAITLPARQRQAFPKDKDGRAAIPADAMACSLEQCKSRR